MNDLDLMQQALDLQSLVSLKDQIPTAFFQPEPDQVQLFDPDIVSDKRLIFVGGGNKSGKTYASCSYIVQRCLEKKNFCIIATWSNLLKELSKKLWELLPKNHLVKYACYNESSGFVRRNILFENGSEIILLTFEQGEDRFQSYSCDYILLDEEPPEPIYNECLMRVAHTDGQILISATPVKGMTYLSQIFQVQIKSDPSIIAFYWDSLNNSYNNLVSMKRTLESLTEDQMQMRRYGKFVNQKSNLIFNQFNWDDNVSTKNPFYPDEYNPSLPIIACFDFNYAILPAILMQKYGDRYYVFDTVSMKSANTEIVATMCKQKYPNATFRIYCDAAGNANKTSASRTDVNILESVFGVRANYRQVKALKDRTEALNAYLKNAKGEHRLIINQRNKELLIDLQVCDFLLYEGRRKQGDRTHHVDALSYYFYVEHALNWKLSGKML